MSKDFASSKKMCGTCGKEIIDGQAYVAMADNFEVGKETALDLLTKSYKWSAYHSTTQPSRVPVVCIAPTPTKNKGETNVR